MRLCWLCDYEFEEANIYTISVHNFSAHYCRECFYALAGMSLDCLFESDDYLHRQVLCVSCFQTDLHVNCWISKSEKTSLKTNSMTIYFCDECFSENIMDITDVL